MLDLHFSVRTAGNLETVSGEVITNVVDATDKLKEC